MKIAYLGLLGICIFYKLSAMDQAEQNYGWWVELHDVPMAALLIPSAPPPQTSPQTVSTQTATPGLLQVLHDTISNRPTRTN